MPRHRDRPAFLKHLSRALLVAGTLLVVVGAPASANAHPAATAPCWKRLLTDSYDGTVDKLYPLPCYHQAIAHLSPAEQIYSNFKTEILEAEQAAAHGRTIAGVKTPTSTGTTTSAAGPSHGSRSIPVPLLVLGGVAIVLLAVGGAGVLWQRRRPGGPASS